MKKLIGILLLTALLGCEKTTPEPKYSCSVVTEARQHLFDEFNMFTSGEYTQEEYSEFIMYFHKQDSTFVAQLKNCE